MTFIYALKCPETQCIRYIGKSNNPVRRLRSHISRAVQQVEKHHSANWIRSLAQRGLEPTMEVLASVTDGQDWRELERSFIAKLKQDGVDLTNTHPGGQGGAPTPDQVQRLVEATKRDWNDKSKRERRVKALSASVSKKWSDPVYRGKCKTSSRRFWDSRKDDPSYNRNRIKAFIAASDRSVFYVCDLRSFCSRRSILSRNISQLCDEGFIAWVSKSAYAKTFIVDGDVALAVPLVQIAATILSDCDVDISKYEIAIGTQHNNIRLRRGIGGKRVSIERPICFNGQHAVVTLATGRRRD